MPMYVYRRLDGSEFELMQSIYDDALTQDPKTGEAVERVLFAPAIRFIGPGFHNNDYDVKSGKKSK